MTRKLNVSSFPVVMPELVKSVLQELRTLVNLALTAGNLCQQHIGYICEYLPIVTAEQRVVLYSV